MPDTLVFRGCRMTLQQAEARIAELNAQLARRQEKKPPPILPRRSRPRAPKPTDPRVAWLSDIARELRRAKKQLAAMPIGVTSHLQCAIRDIMHVNRVLRKHAHFSCKVLDRPRAGADNTTGGDNGEEETR